MFSRLPRMKISLNIRAFFCTAPAIIPSESIYSGVTKSSWESCSIILNLTIQTFFCSLCDYWTFTWRIPCWFIQFCRFDDSLRNLQFELNNEIDKFRVTALGTIFIIAKFQRNSFWNIFSSNRMIEEIGSLCMARHFLNSIGTFFPTFLSWFFTARRKCLRSHLFKSISNLHQPKRSSENLKIFLLSPIEIPNISAAFIDTESFHSMIIDVKLQA